MNYTRKNNSKLFTSMYKIPVLVVIVVFTPNFAQTAGLTDQEVSTGLRQHQLLGANTCR